MVLTRTMVTYAGPILVSSGVAAPRNANWSATTIANLVAYF